MFTIGIVIRATTASALLALSTIVVFADDPRPLTGEEFRMQGIVCANVVDAQKLATQLVSGHVYLDEEILATIAASNLSCRFMDLAAMYAGAVSKSEFTVNGRYFIIDRYVPVEGIEDLYVWRQLRSAPSVENARGL
jgi:hypothetical protein